MQEKKNIFKEIAYWSKIIVFGVVLGTGLQLAQAVWTDPTPGVTPPNQSVVGPITTGAGQVKNGSLSLNGGAFTVDSNGDGTLDAYARNGLIVANGSVGIGVISPSANLGQKGLAVNDKVGAIAFCDKSGENCFMPDKLVSFTCPKDQFVNGFLADGTPNCAGVEKLTPPVTVTYPNQCKGGDVSIFIYGSGHRKICKGTAGNGCNSSVTTWVDGIGDVSVCSGSCANICALNSVGTNACGPGVLTSYSSVWVNGVGSVAVCGKTY